MFIKRIYTWQSAWLHSMALLWCLLGLSVVALAQGQTEISGIVSDEESNEPLQFVNVYFEGTTEGVVTDENGYFSLKSPDSYSAIVLSYVGYEQRVMPVRAFQKQVLAIYLKSQLYNLDEIVVMSGENPAWAIVREAVKRKEKYDKRSLKAYEYQSYNRIEFDIDNLSTKLGKRKVFSDIWENIDSTALEKSADGKAILPVFLSESVSRYYVKNNPFARREEVLKSKISGLAVEDGSMVSQLVGTAYQDYNFYKNWLRFMEKDFISPIADGWKMFYDFDILDTVYVGKHQCFELAVFPNRPQDPAFNGTIWISTDSYALKKVDLYLDEATNLNFINRIELAQELEQSEDGPWLPARTSLTIDVSNLGKNMASFLVKIYTTTSDWKTNDEKDSKYYANEVFIAEDFNAHNQVYWDSIRPEGLSEEQLSTYKVIDTLVDIPRVKSYVELIKLATTGYWQRGKLEYGPYLFAYAHNNYEGHAIRLGMKTNEYFSRKVSLRGYAGYGTQDEQWKYAFTGTYIIKRKPWSEVAFHSAVELEQVGINSDELLASNYIFYAATRWQTFRRPYYHHDNSIMLKSEVAKGLTHKIALRHEVFDPRYPFFYYSDPADADAPLKSVISSPTIKLSTRWARDEMFLQDGNERISLGTRRAPIVQIDYTYGIKDLLDSDFGFHKVQLEWKHKLRLGAWGESNYAMNTGYIFGQIPYLLLENHIGNESSFYTTGAFNTMNFFEFVSDKYATLQYSHYFQGLIMNKLPLIRKLNWRLLATGNVLYGSLRQENKDIISPIDPDGNPTPGFNELNPAIPYVELGYGIENIFKVLRVDAIHRITYRDEPEAQKFVVKFSFQFKL
ncbi:MAG: carboxypeptidase-like regulatory domain-containing protein [Cyclobacteriaceae bacterium]|nr:carboxypeptidase-like regulatory domain-containing protein [Cyclobacteriaceae bacterium]